MMKNQKNIVGDKMMSNKNKGKEPLDGIDCDSICDWPTNRLFKELDEAYPSSKFILTYRNPDECALSWCRMQLQFNMSWPHSYRAFKANTADHYSEVFSHFMGRGKDLLVIDGRDDPERNAKMIAKFIKYKGEVEPYPHEFKHGNWYRS